MKPKSEYFDWHGVRRRYLLDYDYTSIEDYQPYLPRLMELTLC